MIKKVVFLIFGLMILFLGFTKISFGGDKYSEREYKVQKQVIDTFVLDVNDSRDNESKDSKLKPLFMRDIYDDEIAQESHETRVKIAKAINILYKEKEIREGDFKPMIFLKGNTNVLIAVKHPNNTISLTDFDISNKEPVEVDKQVKEMKDNKQQLD
ncbi:hypothetical protein Dtox_0397 [Desulfofarcimen acetoxidans DSM 771]|uniref:Uncharacterized protein n=1 Tax=Desulfofarcimen acetoxidans (strain ATCC 49208 / DSM 771 / KCTC 5769 / VKM B-1644 / 5575) TaxID=485916 RepID=C8W4Y9_DESAS|nr:hypothetical protein [Desulfofarcimen acetoxidans]ACV61341.1 hypothetical protein Dtox_0397 [Desulfofarcimen acetoxidans DSM 771]